jgi:hypothetical protein
MKMVAVIHSRVWHEACAGELPLAPTDLDLRNAAQGRQEGRPCFYFRNSAR